MIRCLGCMKTYEESRHQCPYCGAGQIWIQTDREYLEPGSIIQNRYTIGAALEKRETDIIYIGWDAIFERKVFVQEFFPEYCVSRAEGKNVSIFTAQTRTELFEEGLKAFINNGRKLMYLYKEPDIAEVYSCFKENNTAYMISKYYELPTLREYAEDRKMKTSEIRTLMKAAVQVIEKLHQHGVFHADLNEDRFWVNENKGLIVSLPEPARCICGHLDSLDYGMVGPWTDVYGLSAAFYYLITGRPYIEGADFSGIELRWKWYEKRAIQNGLEKAIHYRTKDIKAFRSEFTGNARRKGRNRHKKEKEKIFQKSIPGLLMLVFATTMGMIFLHTNMEDADQEFVNSFEQDLVRVPNLLNLDIESAKKICGEFGLKLKIVDKKEYDDVIPVNKILKQEPAVQDEFMENGAEITVTLSGGAELVTMPEFIGKEREEINQLAEKIGLQVVFEEEQSDKPAYTAIFQSDEPGRKVKKGSLIVVTISKEKEGEQVQKREESIVVSESKVIETPETEAEVTLSPNTMIFPDVETIPSNELIDTNKSEDLENTSPISPNEDIQSEPEVYEAPKEGPGSLILDRPDGQIINISNE